MLGAPEMIILLVVFFLLFGAKRLPEFARSAGEAMKEFKKATREAMAEDDVAPAAPQRRMEAPAEEAHKTSTSA